MLVINEAINYDPFKKDMKIDDKNGRWTDGWGHSYTIGKPKSDKISYKGMKFEYDYKKQELLIYVDNKLIEEVSLDISNWLDNPEYWIKEYYDHIA